MQLSNVDRSSDRLVTEGCGRSFESMPSSFSLVPPDPPDIIARERREREGLEHKVRRGYSDSGVIATNCTSGAYFSNTRGGSQTFAIA